MTFNKPEDEQDPKANEVMKKLRQSYKKFTDGVMEFPKRKDFKGDAIISAYGEFLLVTSYVELEKQEDRLLKEIQSELEEIKIYRLFLKDVKGIGPILGGVIVAEIDIHRAKHPSSLWKFAGLDVAEDGRGRGKYKDHCVTVDGSLKRTYNGFLKTKLIGVLAPSFLRSKSPYSEIYYDYKNRLENHAVYKDESKGKRDGMAKRYMVKMFLIDLYTKWRKLEKLPVSKPYSEAKLGYKHKKSDKAVSTKKPKRAKRAA